MNGYFKDGNALAVSTRGVCPCCCHYRAKKLWLIGTILGKAYRCANCARRYYGQTPWKK